MLNDKKGLMKWKSQIMKWIIDAEINWCVVLYKWHVFNLFIIWAHPGKGCEAGYKLV